MVSGGFAYIVGVGYNVKIELLVLGLNLLAADGACIKSQQKEQEDLPAGPSEMFCC